MALPQLYASCLLYRLVSVWCSSGVSSVAFLLLGGASVAALASDWTERHRSRIAASCCPIPPTRGTCPFGGSSLGHLVEWGLPAVCTWCVWLSDPPCHMMIIIYHHHTFSITHDTATSATDYRKSYFVASLVRLADLGHVRRVRTRNILRVDY